MTAATPKPCTRFTASGQKCGNVTANANGWCGQCAGAQNPAHPAASISAADTKALEAAGLAVDPLAAGAFEAEVGALESSWRETLEAADVLGPGVFPVHEQYEVLVRYGAGVQAAVHAYGPDPDTCAVAVEDKGELRLVVDIEQWENAMRTRLPGAEGAVRDAAAAADTWLSDRTDTELVELAQRNGRPHFAAVDRPTQELLLNPGIALNHPQKATYDAQARHLWFKSGNSRYGPTGYTLDPDVQAALAPFVRQAETSRGPMTVFNDMDGPALKAAVDHLPAAHQWDRRKGGPTMRRLADLAASHPDIRFSGLVVGPGDPPHEGVRVQMITVPDEKLSLPVFRELAELDEVQVAAAPGDRTHLAWM